MNPYTLAFNIGWQLGTYIANKLGRGATLQDAVDSIVAVDNWVGRALAAMFEYGGQEIGAVQFSAQYAKQIGHDFEEIEGRQQERWNRLFEVIMPNSLAHAVGYVYSDGIVPLRHTVSSLSDSLFQAWQNIGNLNAWRNNVAQPELNDLESFKATFMRDYLPAIEILRDWLANPSHFGEWAAPPVIGPIVAYLADDSHKQTRDNLTDILAQAWAETPDKVWADFEEMLVS